MHTPSISRQVSGKRRVFALLLGLFLLISSTCAYSEGVSVSSRIDALLSAQQSAAGADSLQSWLNGALCKQAGSSAEWYVLALRQNTQGLDYSAYADALQQYVEIAPPASASSRLKLALLLTACGRADHPFVAAARAEDIGRQGVMSWIYGLHLLNNLPGTAGEIDQAVASLLSLQLADGGWAVMGAQSDADVTAMALQALAPTLANHSDAQAAADRALALLSAMQADTGDYRSMGTSNCESAAQVIIALCALGIDPLTDARFIKNGCSALDAMLRYQLEDNAFAHTVGNAKNNMATVQALSALIALKRFQAGQGSYYLLDALPAAQQAAADLARIKTEKLPIPAGVQTALAEHYQALLHTNDFYQYLTLFKELGQKQTQQQSRGRKINAMDAYFYQMVERVLREELAVAFGESQQEAGRRLLEVLR